MSRNFVLRKNSDLETPAWVSRFLKDWKQPSWKEGGEIFAVGFIAMTGNNYQFASSKAIGYAKENLRKAIGHEPKNLDQLRAELFTQNRIGADPLVFAMVRSADPTAGVKDSPQTMF